MLTNSIGSSSKSGGSFPLGFAISSSSLPYAPSPDSKTSDNPRTTFTFLVPFWKVFALDLDDGLVGEDSMREKDLEICKGRGRGGSMFGFGLLMLPGIRRIILSAIVCLTNTPQEIGWFKYLVGRISWKERH